MDARKILHDERKDDLDANEHIAELLLEKRDLFQTQENQDLGTEIAAALPTWGLKQKSSWSFGEAPEESVFIRM